MKVNLTGGLKALKNEGTRKRELDLASKNHYKSPLDLQINFRGSLELASSM